MVSKIIGKDQSIKWHNYSMKEHWYNEQIYPKNNTDKEGFSYMKYSKRLEQLKPIINELNQICAEEEAICNGALN